MTRRSGPRRPNADAARANSVHLALARRVMYAPNMTITKSILFTCSLSIAAVACKASDKNEAPVAKTADPATAAPAKLAWKKLGDLGLEASVPDDANIEDKSKSAGFPAVTVWATPTTFINGAGDDSLSAQTFDKAKEEIQKDPNPFKQFTKAETTPDGWRLEYELESMVDKKPVYGFKVRFKIDGKPYECGSNGDSTAERDNVIKLCTSIRKAK